MKRLNLNKKALTLVVAVIAILLAVTAPAALAWEEGPGVDWYFINANIVGGNWYSTAPPVIEINGSSVDGQTFNVGDSITISAHVHAYAASCSGWANGAYTNAGLEVNGPSGADSDTAGGDNYSNYCAEVDTEATLSIAYALTAAGTHQVYANSYAAVSQYCTDVAEETVDASLTFEVIVPLIEVDIDIKPGSDPNCFNSDGHGVIPVAILGSADFDASTVDPSTVSLDGVVVRMKGKSGNAGSLEDVNGDGVQDLVVQIIDDGGYGIGDTMATLEGFTYDGTPIEGSDEICLRPELAATLYVSSVMNFSGTGWAGWSCPPEYPNVIDGGVSKTSTQPFTPADYPVVQGPAKPGSTVGGSTYPVFPHYTFGTWYPGETGWVVQNGGTPQSLYIYVYCGE
jgi:hypothetical protein